MTIWHPAARRTAERAHAALSGRATRRRQPGDSAQAPAPLPDVDEVAQAIDIAFWASLRREEGETPTISLAFVAPAAAPDALRFHRPLPLTPDAVARLAPAVKRPGMHLGVSRRRGVLGIWGTTRRVPPLTLVLEVIAAGVLVLKYRQATEHAKYVNVTVLEGDQLKVINQIGELPGCPTPLTAQFGLDEPGSPWREMADILVQVAVSMRALAHGGTLLIVPDDHEVWRASLVRSIPYALTPPYRALALGGSESLDEEAREAARHAVVDAIAGLTAVDGATVLRGGRDIVAFGAKIVRRRGSAHVRHVLLSEPIEGNVPTVVSTTQLGGTRHLSGAQFVHDQRDALALVSSQDGRFTVFSWNNAAQQVGARRVEVLLL